MYRFVVFLIGVALVKTDVDVRHCFETAAFEIGCCHFNITEEVEAIMKECAENHDQSPQSCDYDTCYGEKVGILLSNGTVDKASLEAMIEKDFEVDTDLMKIVKEKCLVDDLSFYGPPRMCDIKKIGNCLHVYAVLNCPTWKDTEHCSRVRQTLDECESVFP